MNKKTREEIFAESDKRYPDYNSYSHHALSLGFESGATWYSNLEEEPTEGAVNEAANTIFPCDMSDKIADGIAAQRRQGFFGGVKWVQTNP